MLGAGPGGGGIGPGPGGGGPGGGGPGGCGPGLGGGGIGPGPCFGGRGGGTNGIAQNALGPLYFFTLLFLRFFFFSSKMDSNKYCFNCDSVISIISLFINYSKFNCKMHSIKPSSS